VAAVKRRRRKIELIRRSDQICNPNDMHEALGESIRTFMKMASPDGTLSNMSPPTCSTPVEHLEIDSNEWLKFCSSVKVKNYLMIYEMARSEDIMIEQYQDRQARLRRHGVDHN
jgi:hypothetical protein